MKLSAILLTTMLATTVSTMGQSNESSSKTDTKTTKKCTAKVGHMEKSKAPNDSIPRLYLPEECVACGMG